jgi:NAD(P)H dehydrogenase (quinone)
VAFVDHDDIAAVIAAVVVEDDADDNGAVLEVTGPAALTMAQAAEIAGLRYQEETVEDGFAWRAALGASGPLIDGWISWYLAIARGEVGAVSTVVNDRTGHAPRSLAETLGS